MNAAPLPLAWLSLVLCAGCGDDGTQSILDAAVDADVDAAVDVDADGPPSCAATGTPRALVLSLNGTEDVIEVRSLVGGQVLDQGLRFTGVVNPDEVAIRSDGREALVSFGSFGQNYGVVVLELGAGGQSASIRQTLVLGADRRPFGLAYASDSRAVVAMAGGPSGHLLIGLERGPDGMFAAGPSSPVPDDWPLALRRRPGHDQVVLVRALLSSDPDSDIYLLSRNGSGAWAPTGTAAMVTARPFDVAIMPDGATALAATSDPADPITPQDLDGMGLLHRLPISDAGLGANTTLALPGPGGSVAIDPRGRFVLVESPVYELDPMTETPITFVRRFITIPVDAGTYGAPLVEAQPWQALLLHGLAIAPSGHVVRSRELYPDQAPPNERRRLDVLLPAGDGSMMECSSTTLPGQGQLAIAP